MQENEFWQIEQACRDAWPAVREEQVQGWLFRISGGETRRTNSVNATSGAKSVLEVLPEADAFFERYERPLLFRTLSFQPEVDAELAAAGFCNLGETVCTLRASLEADGGPFADNATAANVEVSLVPTPEWIGDKLRLTPMTAPQERAYRRMLHHLRVPVAFVRISNDQKGLGVAYGAISEDMLIIESVVTDPDHRGQGLGATMVGALMRWGFGAGAETACLQVVSDNAPARALYQKLGFNEELYRYAYWARG